MPAPAIKKGSDHFFNVTYGGNGRGQRVGKFVPFTDNGTIDRVLYLMMGILLSYLKHHQVLETEEHSHLVFG